VTTRTWSLTTSKARNAGITAIAVGLAIGGLVLDRNNDSTGASPGVALTRGSASTIVVDSLQRGDQLAVAVAATDNQTDHAVRLVGLEAVGSHGVRLIGVGAMQYDATTAFLTRRGWPPPGLIELANFRALPVDSSAEGQVVLVLGVELTDSLGRTGSVDVIYIEDGVEHTQRFPTTILLCSEALSLAQCDSNQSNDTPPDG
jgi:hypothetical protein